MNIQHRISSSFAAARETIVTRHAYFPHDASRSDVGGRRKEKLGAREGRGSRSEFAGGKKCIIQHAELTLQRPWRRDGTAATRKLFCLEQDAEAIGEGDSHMDVLSVEILSLQQVADMRRLARRERIEEWKRQEGETDRTDSKREKAAIKRKLSCPSPSGNPSPASSPASSRRRARG